MTVEYFYILWKHIILKTAFVMQAFNFENCICYASMHALTMIRVSKATFRYYYYDIADHMYGAVSLAATMRIWDSD